VSYTIALSKVNRYGRCLFGIVFSCPDGYCVDPKLSYELQVFLGKQALLKKTGGHVLIAKFGKLGVWVV
jgi:hypothetical protein